MGHQPKGSEVRAHPPAPARLLHYWCPVALGWSVSMVVGRATGLPLSPVGRGVLLLSIWAAYGFDRLMDGPSDGLSRGVSTTLWAGFAVAVAGVCLLVPRLPRGTLALLPVLSLAGLGYRRVKAYPMVKALLVPGVWTWAGVALPLADGSWFGWRALTHPVAAPLFLLIAAGTLLCDVKDAEQDRVRGVRSLPVQVGVAGTLALAGGLAVAGVLAAFRLARFGLVVDGILLALLAGCRPLVERETWGPLLVDLVLTVPGVLILLHWV